ncbi:MAG TPA: TolC family protein [Pirellulaceae bacterium]|nr:TolC family protein [Pirellulaceae bacterium]HMO92213.1 TolC family protein [Pirellulaceae bacterium]HMP68860.1 TolC family protein [Pirellulaceae bacterium]
MFRLFSTPFSCLAIFLAITSVGCRTSDRVQQAAHDRVASERLHACYSADAYFELSDDAATQFSGPQSLDEYLHIGLLQNPEIQKARFMVDALSQRIPQAASLDDPMLEVMTGVSHVETAAGPQDLALGLSQMIPWRGKREMRTAIAIEEVQAARAELLAVELKVVEQIKTAYHQLYFIQQAISITERDRQQLALIGDVVLQRYQVKREVTQQDVLQVQVALSQIDAELVQLRQQKASTQARLARLMHLPPSTQFEALDSFPAEQILHGIQNLYQLAVESRPELQSQLAKIQRDRKAVCLAMLENYPDMTFGVNWIAVGSDGLSPVANGEDSLMLTLGLNLPIYRNRIDAGIREARFMAMASAQEYETMRDETLESITDLFAKMNSQYETLTLFRDNIIPKQKLTLEQSIEDYTVGSVDFLQLIEIWRQLFRFQIQEKRLEADLHQSLAELSRVLGQFQIPVTLENAQGHVGSWELGLLNSSVPDDQKHPDRENDE